MEKYHRLCSGNSMKSSMRPAMAMIELIFAIVIIAISVISIPSMISVAGQSAKQIAIDDDVMSRLTGWTIDKFQARWDGNYSASGSGPLVISGDTDLPCNRAVGSDWYRQNNESLVPCDPLGNPPSAIIGGDGNLTKGIEQLNGGSEPIVITAASGETYTITATYAVDYVSSALDGAPVGNTATATWTLGSSTMMSPGAGGTSHLKRVVTRFSNNALGVDTTLTFFKSNKGN